MFETSIILLIKALLLNIFIPIFTGILFIWVFFWFKYKWIILYIISFFIWTWVIAFSLFNLQFFYFWIWIIQYLILNIILLLIFLIKIYLRKEKINQYLINLKIEKIQSINQYFELSLVQRIIYIFGSFFVVIFLFISFLYNINFPSYSDDSFTNWNNPAINIYYDWWVKLIWNQDEILWKWRLWYPIYLPIYKALISDFFWSFNDIYINLWNFLSFLFFIIFIYIINLKDNKNLFFSILSVILICWLPLIFFHTVEWYFDLASAIYSVFMIYFLYNFLKNNDYEDWLLWTLFWFILANIKNDWLIVYFTWIIIWFILYTIFSKKIIWIIKEWIKRKDIIFKKLFFALYFFLPFIILKSFLWLWYNQAAWETKWIWFSFHPEIFWVFPTIFINEDNYNISLVFLFIIIFILIKKLRNKEYSDKLFLALSSFSIILIFILVFLFTDNYKWVLDQTTVNRVFTMSFVILFSFIWILSHEKIN